MHITRPQRLLIQSYLPGLMVGQGDRLLSAFRLQPTVYRTISGISRFPDRWKGALLTLRGADKAHACANDLIPPDPTNTAFAGI